MSEVIRVALLGFSAFERSAMGSYFRLAARRQPAFELVPEPQMAQLIIVDGDSGAALRQLYLAHREADALAIGAMKPPGVARHQKRPIDPLHVLRDLEFLLAEQAQHGRAFVGTEPAAFQSLPSPVTPDALDLDLSSDDDVPTVSDEATGFVQTASGSPGQFKTLAAMAPEAAAPAGSGAARPAAGLQPSPAFEAAKERARSQAVAAAQTRRESGRRRRRGNAMGSKAVGRHALLVESDEVAALRLESQLSRFGVSTAIAHSAEAALRQAAEGGFDFVFINVSLDGQSDGIALCRQLRQQAHPPGEIGPLLVLQAAQAAHTLRVQGTMAGADAFLAQPVVEAALQSLLAAHGVKPLSGPVQAG